MHLYRAYGLTIASEIALPELVTAAEFDAATVSIHRSRIDRTISPDTAVVFDIAPRRAYLAWREVGAFLVEDGKTITADLRPGVPDDVTRLPLLGAVLAVLLHQRGYLVLHGSAVAIADQAVIFVGSKGAGKSTMAAALLARGHRLIADDVVAIDCTGDDGALVAPGYPQLKLSADAAGVVLKLRGDALPRIHPHAEKRARRIGKGGFLTGPLRAGRVYALAIGESCRSLPAAPQLALTTLLQHSYMARFGNQVLHGPAAGIHLRQCVALADQAPVHRLEVPNALQDLDQTARLVEADVGVRPHHRSHLSPARPPPSGMDAHVPSDRRTAMHAPGGNG